MSVINQMKKEENDIPTIIIIMNKLNKQSLMNAVVHGTYEDVKNAFNEHELVFDESYFDYKLLIAASKRNNTEILKYLLYNTKCRVVNPDKIKLEETPLHIAMKLNESVIIEELLRRGASLFDKDENGEVPIIVGIKSKNYKAVEALLNYCKYHCKSDDIDLRLHFHIACIIDSDTVGYYLFLWGNPNTPFSLVLKQYCGSSLNPVQFAAEKNYWSLFRSLVHYGGDISIKNAKGLTPLHIIYYDNSMSVEKRKSRIKWTFEIVNDTKFVNVVDNVVDNNGVSHFHMCCMLDKPDFVQKFIDDGANVNSSISLSCPIDSGYTPLHFAVKNDCERVVELLLKNGADCNKQDKEGRTPLHLACKTSRDLKDHIVKLLLDYQADPAIKDKQGCTPLHMEFYFAKNRKSQIVLDMLVSKITGEINFTNNEGLSHFHIACATNKVNLIKDFLEAGVNIGANVNSSTFFSCPIDSGYTPLHFAVINGCERVVELLLKNGADCNKQDKEGMTPLHLTRRESSAHCKAHIIVKRVSDYQANPAIKDKQRYTPLTMEFYHATNENRIIFDMLLSKITRKIVNVTNSAGLSHFHIACTTNKINLIKDFLEAGVNIDACVSFGMYSGYTALHFAVLNNQKDVVEFLLKKNAQVNIKSKMCKVTPLHLACDFNYAKFRKENDNENKNIQNFEPFPVNVDSISNRRNQLDIISLLLSHGAQVDAKDYQGMTPLLHTCMLDRSYSELNWSFMSNNLTNTFKMKKEINIRIKEIIEQLMSYKAKVNACSYRQESILHIISKYSSLHVTKKNMKSILSEDINVDAVDDAGLTPLHVAVRANNKWMVQILLEHNASVNVRCKNSRTPLHMAFPTPKPRNLSMEAQNDIVDKLLNYGADINIEDPFGKTCISLLLEWSDNYQNIWSESDLYVVFQTIKLHIQKLLALNLHVSEKVQKICSELYIYYNYDLDYMLKNELDSPFRHCTEELERMKLIKINNNTSLYSIILLIQAQHELAKYARNKNLIKIIKAKKLYEDFPKYCNMLRTQFTRACIRRDLLQSAKASLNHIFKASIPDLCLDEILKNLEINDFVNLNKVVPSKRSLKRKLNDTILRESESITNDIKERIIDG